MCERTYTCLLVEYTRITCILYGKDKTQAFRIRFFQYSYTSVCGDGGLNSDWGPRSWHLSPGSNLRTNSKILIHKHLGQREKECMCVRELVWWFLEMGSWVNGTIVLYVIQSNWFLHPFKSLIKFLTYIKGC